MQDWLAFGQADVMAHLSRYGYGTAAPTNVNGLAWLEKMNCLRACMNIEMTYPVTEWGQPNQRMTMFQTQWDEGIELLKSGQLVSIGIAGSASTSLSDNLKMTGLSLSRKQSREAETDRVAGKFPRGWGQSNRDINSNRYDPNRAQD